MKSSDMPGMVFPEFFGNNNIKTQLASAFKNKTPFHAYIISGAEGLGKSSLARILGAALLCDGEGSVPCLRCGHCLKVFKDGHPDLITVQSDKQTLPVELIRNMRSDAFILPNEGRRKVYIIKNAQTMAAPSQNALLKILEEPPQYAAFLILTASSGSLLDTLRSRCLELALRPLSREESIRALQSKYPKLTKQRAEALAQSAGGVLGKAIAELEGEDEGATSPAQADFLQAFTEGGALELLSASIALEKLKRDELESFLIALKADLLEKLKAASRPGYSGLEAGLILEAVSEIDSALGYLPFNIGPAHLMGMLCVQLQRIRSKAVRH